MTTHTAHNGLSFDALRNTLRPTRQALPSAADRRTPARSGWLERLAQWSERQPVHHRLGSYMWRG